MKNLIKNILFVILFFLIVSSIFAVFFSPQEKPEEISLTQVVKDINQDQVKQIVVSGNSLEITYKEGDAVKTSKKETEDSLSQSLINYGAEQEKIKNIEVKTKEESSFWTWFGPLMFTILPLLIFVFFFWSFFKQAKGNAMQAFDFSKARARLFGADGHPRQRITFKDVAGQKEAKEELKEIIDFLKNPKKYLQIGARIPRGVLLLGPAGVGKTLLARAVAGEANVPFFSISGSEFVEMFVGVGAARVRDLFSTAKRAAPSLLFIDELDAVGRQRGAGLGGGHDEREQTLNQILVEMDGFERETNVIIIAATNRGDILDPALLRPGRFDRKVMLDLPDLEDREAILKIHCQGKPLSSDIDIREVAERTPGFSGADLANVVNEGAILAARKNKNQVSQKDLLDSIEKVLLGPERRSHILSKKEKRITAFHEAGHALVSSSLPDAEPIRKISIVARGMAAGYTLKMPSEEKRMKSKSEFLAEMATLLGGYCAEKMKFGEMTTGAGNDLERASDLARRIVKEYGMSSLGPISFGGRDELVFLGREISEQRNYSEKVATEIDKEVSRLIKDAEERANKILIRKKAVLEKIAETLIKEETIEKEEFDKIIGSKKEKSGKHSTKKEKSVKVSGERA